MGDCIFVVLLFEVFELMIHVHCDLTMAFHECIRRCATIFRKVQQFQKYTRNARGMTQGNTKVYG